MLYAAEVKKDIADLLAGVPALDDSFNVIDKIGAGITYCSLYVLLIFDVTFYHIRYWCFEFIGS